MTRFPHLFLMILSLSAGKLSGADLTASDRKQLTAALERAAPGDTISVSFDPGNVTITAKKGAPGKLITIKADERLARTARTITIKDSSHLKIEGFTIADFDGTALKIIESHDLVITRNRFDFAGIDVANGIYTAGGRIHTIEISHNEFNHHTAEGRWSGSYIKTWFDGSDVARKLWIHHNLFANVAPRQSRSAGDSADPYDGDSDRETIVFGEGDSQNIETHHLIEFNLFEDCDGENEMVSFKTSKNIFRHNTVKNCMGGVSIRFGHGSEVYGNVFTGDAVTDFGGEAYLASANYESSGVRIYGSDHQVYNNHFENLTGGRTSKHRLPVILDSGETDGTGGDKHQRPRNVLVSHNTFVNCQHGIGIGLNYKLAPKDCLIANNLLTGIANPPFRFGPESEKDNSCQYVGNLVWAADPDGYGTDKPLSRADPGLEKAVFNGYRLSVPGSGSPAIDASMGSSFKEDVFGGARNGVPDVGAREVGAEARRLPLATGDVGPAGP